MRDKLNPCPLCGGKPKIEQVRLSLITTKRTVFWVVTCGGCKTSTRPMKKETACRNWNKNSEQ